MEQKNIQDPMKEPGISGLYDDESMKKKFEGLSDANKVIIDQCVNSKGQFSFENIVDIILSANEEQRKEISATLSDFRMATDTKLKNTIAQEFVSYLNSL